MKNYTLTFALLFAVTASVLIYVCIELKAEKAANNVFKEEILKDNEIKDKKIDSLMTAFNGLMDSNTEIKADVEDLRNTKADAKTKKNEDKNNASNATAEYILSKWAER